MDNKRWTAVTGVLILTAVVVSTIFLQQRNEARLRWRESRNQITELEQRNVALNESLQKHVNRLSAEANLVEKKQAALMSAESQITELKARLDERQTKLDAVRTQFQHADSQTAKLKKELAFIEERITALEKKIQTLRNTMAVKEKQLAESQESLWALKTEADGLKKDMAVVKASADELEAQLKELTHERDGLIAQITALKTVGDGLRERIAEMETRHREALTGRDEKIAKLSSALENSDKRLGDLEKDKGILVSKLSEANRTITGLRDQLQEVITQVPELKDRLEQSLVKYQVVRENLTEAIARQAKLEAQQKAMRTTYEALVTGLKQQLDSREAFIEEYREKLKVTFVDRILFGFSQVRISPEGKAALDQLAGVLANVPEGKISITGHADNIPIAEKFWYRFPSNWELSSARAAAVTRYLLEQGGLEPSRIEVIGLSRYHPVAENDTEAGRAKNRRVEIIIAPGLYPGWESRQN